MRLDVARSPVVFFVKGQWARDKKKVGILDDCTFDSGCCDDEEADPRGLELGDRRR